jgi:hypothetical protein
VEPGGNGPHHVWPVKKSRGERDELRSRESTRKGKIFSFFEGHLFIVRNAHSCLPDPPLETTPDPSVDTLTFTREFKLEGKALFSFLLKIFGAGGASGELQAKEVRSATVTIGGLSHYTIQTGALIDFLLKQDPKSPCMRDILNKANFLIVAGLRASSFTYNFKNESGATVKFSGPEVNGMFKADASVEVNVLDQGQVVVNSPAFVGVVTWDGNKIGQELLKARKFASGRKLRRFEPPSVFDLANEPKEIRAGQIASLGILAKGKKRR